MSYRKHSVGALEGLRSKGRSEGLRLGALEAHVGVGGFGGALQRPQWLWTSLGCCQSEDDRDPGRETDGRGNALQRRKPGVG